MSNGNRFHSQHKNFIITLLLARQRGQRNLPHGDTGLGGIPNHRHLGYQHQRLPQPSDFGL